MTPKAEFINALQHKPIVNQTPIWELEFHLWDKFQQGKFTIGSDFVKLSTAQKDYAIEENAETVAKVCELLHFSAVTVPGGYWEVVPNVPAFYWLPDNYRMQQAKQIKKILGDNIALVVNVGGVMAMPEGNDYVDFSIKMMENPNEIDAIAKKNTEASLERIDIFADLGMDVFLTASDLADSHSLYFSPDQMERYIYPYLSKWAEYIKNKGFHSILHTDGNINPALHRIANSGVDGLQAIDTNAKMNIQEIQHIYADKLCVCGNLDCGMMIKSDEEIIYEATKTLLVSMKEKGSFVLGASNALEYETPAKNYMAIIKAWIEYGAK